MRPVAAKIPQKDFQYISINVQDILGITQSYKNKKTASKGSRNIKS